MDTRTDAGFLVHYQVLPLWFLPWLQHDTSFCLRRRRWIRYISLEVHPGLDQSRTLRSKDEDDVFSIIRTGSQCRFVLWRHHSAVPNNTIVCSWATKANAQQVEFNTCNGHTTGNEAATRHVSHLPVHSPQYTKRKRTS
jgi:hypothetical protein